MSDRSSTNEWDFSYRPTRMPRLAWLVAVAVFAVHVVFAVLLRVSDTGVDLRISDQIAIGGIGAILAILVLSFTRPRLRVGPAGVQVRNLFGERIFDWVDVAGLWYPDSGRWARLELPAFENVAVMAVQAADGAAAVAAMDVFRELHEKYSTASVPPTES